MLMGTCLAAKSMSHGKGQTAEGHPQEEVIMRKCEPGRVSHDMYMRIIGKKGVYL